MAKRQRRQRSPDANLAREAATVAAGNKSQFGEEEKKEMAMNKQLDLFAPILQHYISLLAPTSTVGPGVGSDDGAQVTNDVKPASRPVLNGNGTGDLTSQEQQQPEQNSSEFLLPQRYEVLNSFVFPSTVNGYLSRVSLLPEDVTSGSEMKRHRVESFPHQKEGEEKLLESIRRIADARLPPFADDSEFIAAHESRYVWNEWVALTSVFANANTQLLRMVTMAKLDLFQQCRPCQKVAIDMYTSHITTRLQKMRLPPRVVRVAQKLQLQPREMETLTYVLVCHCGSVWPLNCGGNGSLTPAALALHNNLNSFQLMHFLADYREHIKQGMLTSDIKLKSSFMDCRLAMPQEVIAALSGDSLSEEQLIRLEKTALAEILVEEREDANIAAAAGTSGEKAMDKTETTHHPNNEDAEEEMSNCTSGGSTPNLEALVVDPNILQVGEEGNIETAVTERLQKLLSNLQQPQQGGGTTGRNGSVASSTSCVVTGSTLHVPYASDIDYMDESFKLIANVVRLRGAESEIKDEDEAIFTPKTKMEAMIRELRGKVRVATAIHRSRTEATIKAGKFLPRIEALSQRLQLSDLEKRIMLLLIGNVVSNDILIAINGRYVMREGQRVLTVGYILFVLCDNLKERVAARRSFYQSGPLISNSVLSLSLDGGGRTCFNTDLMDYVVDIDRKIVDYLMGTETETAEMVPGSRLYMPVVPMEKVVLPKNTTDMVVTTIQHYTLFEQCKRSCGFHEGLGTSTGGLVFLFYGPSGTGKTMLANAVAHELHKRILLVSLLQFKNDTKAPEMLRFIFREAKLNDAIVFFDECESIFESRETNPLVTSILAEFEKYDGLIVLATNKAQLIDEAMNRRISLMVEFRLPDQQMREKIWRAHLPSNLTLHEDVSIATLALNYELSGGLIRNATLAALNRAVAREKTSTPTLCMRDFEEGARLQLRGFFLAAEKPPGASTESYITPKRSLADLVVERQTQKQLDAVARLSKGRSTLFSQWGFNEDDCVDQGALYLFHGPSGTGKSLAVEGIAYECAATIRLCNVAELLLVGALKVHEVFDEGRKLGAIIVFDEAQVLFNHSEQSLHVAKLIYYHAVRYPRPVIFIATTGTPEASSIDVRATSLIFQQEILFRLPTQQLRRELWRRALPERMPVADDIDLDVLSETPVSAKTIHSAAFNACCTVAMLNSEERRLTMQMLRDELEKLRLKEKHCQPHSVMFA